jgi:putative transcriptional regulator
VARQSLRGSLLVANPAMPDPNFDRTVVLLLEHGAGGALGVVLNRPTDRAVGEVLPEWAEAAVAPAVVFSGGPVQAELAIGLGRSSAAVIAGWNPVAGGIGVVDFDAGTIGAVSQVRLFAGYAGRGPGQLEGEIEARGWFIAQPAPDDILTDAPADLWRAVLRRQRAGLALLASFPADASLN